jgi:hypothetical protein
MLTSIDKNPKPSGGLNMQMRPAEKQPAGALSDGRTEPPNLRSINAQRRLFKNNLGQVTKQRKCKHCEPQPRKGQEQNNDRPCDQGENHI